MAMVIPSSIAITTSRSSQLHRGSIPKARMKMNATTRFSTRLKSAVRTTDKGMTSRGNCVFRTIASCETIAGTEVLVAS